MDIFKSTNKLVLFDSNRRRLSFITVQEACEPINAVSRLDSDENWCLRHIRQLVDRWKNSNDTAQNQVDVYSIYFSTKFGAICSLVFLCIRCLVPTLQVAIGTTYRTKCTMNPNIPLYLIGVGACGLAHFLLRTITVR